MASAEFKDTLAVDKTRLLETITQYEDYPDFVEGCVAVQVDRKTATSARVAYQVNVMSQDVTYVLDLTEDPDQGTIYWTLVESNFFKKNSGKWEIKAREDSKTDVLYSLDIEFKIPVPGFILNRLVKGSLPPMVRSFERQALKKKGK